MREDRRGSPTCRLRVRRCCELLLTRPRPPNLSPWDRRDKQVSATISEEIMTIPRSLFIFPFGALRPTFCTTFSLDCTYDSSGINHSAIPIARVTFAETKMKLQRELRRNKKIIKILAATNGLFFFFTICPISSYDMRHDVRGSRTT